jgi:hypothetical protein
MGQQAIVNQAAFDIGQILGVEHEFAPIELGSIHPAFLQWQPMFGTAAA